MEKFKANIKTFFQKQRHVFDHEQIKQVLTITIVTAMLWGFLQNWINFLCNEAEKSLFSVCSSSTPIRLFLSLASSNTLLSVLWHQSMSTFLRIQLMGSTELRREAKTFLAISYGRRVVLFVALAISVTIEKRRDKVRKE